MTDTVVPKTAIPGFPFSRDPRCPFDPPPEYAALRDEAPISRVQIWSGQTPWLISRYADQRAVLADPRFSVDPGNPGFPPQSATVGARPRTFFINQDNPEHDHYRRMFAAHFTVKRVTERVPQIKQVIESLLDDMEAAGPPVDLVEDFAVPMPSLVVASVFGVPTRDMALFRATARRQLSTSTTPDDHGLALSAYLSDLIDAKNQDPGDDLLSSLIVERLRTGQLSREELIANVIMLLVGAHDTTASMIALGTLALLRHPDQLAIVRDTREPARVAGAVEELLRYLTVPHSGRRRVATADVEIGGQLIRAGEGVIVASDSANRDPAVFSDPDRLDVDRADAHAHMAFGHGIHQCIGQNLARVELQFAVPALLRRFPSLRTALPDEEIRFREDAVIYGLHQLPVTW